MYCDKVTDESIQLSSYQLFLSRIIPSLLLSARLDGALVTPLELLARAFQALAKIGDELFVEAKMEKLTFLTFNQSKTICGQYHLLESFFSIYEIKDKLLNENSAISCKIHMKNLLPLFKGTHLEKKLEFVKIEYEPPKDTIEFKIKYKTDDIIMSHVLHLMDPEILSIDDYSESRSNNICAGSAFYNNLLTLFSTSDDDITLEITKNKMVARNYYVGAPHRPKSVRSQVNLNSSEFSLYKIKDDATINFSLKPLRTAVAFADVFGLNIGTDFDKGGRPLIISMKNPTFEVMFIVATINPYADGQSTIATTSLPAKITQVRTVNTNGVQQNLTSDDLEAIANENWEEFDTESDNLRKSPERDKSNSKSQVAAKRKEKKQISEANLTNWLGNKKNSSKGPKRFVLEDDDHQMNNSENRETHSDRVDDDFVPRSPESPRTKKARIIFKRSYDATFHPSMRNNVLLRDSDSE